MKQQDSPANPTVSDAVRTVTGWALADLPGTGRGAAAVIRGRSGSAAQALAGVSIALENADAPERDDVVSRWLLTAVSDLIVALANHDQLQRRLPFPQTLATVRRGLTRAVEDDLGRFEESDAEKSTPEDFVHDAMVELRDIQAQAISAYGDRRQGARRKMKEQKGAEVADQIWGRIVGVTALWARIATATGTLSLPDAPPSTGELAPAVETETAHDASELRNLGADLGTALEKAGRELVEQGRLPADDLISAAASLRYAVELAFESLGVEPGGELSIAALEDLEEQRAALVDPDREMLERLVRLTGEGEASDGAQKVAGLAGEVLSVYEGELAFGETQAAALRFLDEVIGGAAELSPERLNEGVPMLIAAGLEPSLLFPQLLSRLNIAEPGTDEGGDVGEKGEAGITAIEEPALRAAESEAEEVLAPSDPSSGDEQAPAPVEDVGGDPAVVPTVEIRSVEPSAEEPSETSETSETGVPDEVDEATAAAGDDSPAEAPAITTAAPLEPPGVASPDGLEPAGPKVSIAGVETDSAAPPPDPPADRDREKVPDPTPASRRPADAPGKRARQDAPLDRPEGDVDAVDGDETSKAWDDLVADALTAGDVSVAYWASRAGGAGQFAPEALEALALAESLGTEMDQTAEALESRFARILEEPRTGPSALVSAAAALRGALVAPYGSAPTVLREVGRNLVPMASVLSETCLLLADRAQAGELAELGTSSYSRQVADVERQLQVVLDAAREGRDRWPKETHRYLPVGQIWRRWSTGSGPMANLLTIVANNRAEQLDAVEALIGEWSSDKFVGRRMDEAFGELRRSRNHKDQLEAGARQWLAERVGRVIDLARVWAHHVQELERERGHHRGTDIADLRAAFRRREAAVDAELSELRGSPNRPVAAAAEAISVTWAGLQRLVETGDPQFGPARDPDAALNRGLVRAVELSLDARGEPAADPSDLEVQALRAALDRTWEEAFEARLAENHHVATHIALMELADAPGAASLAARREAELAAARARLAARVRDLELRASRLLRCAVLHPSEHARQVTVLDSLRSNPPEALPPAERRLSEIEDRMQALADGRSEELRNRLSAARADEDERARIEQLIREEQYDVADELTARLEQGERLPAAEPHVDLLQLFIETLEIIGVPGVDPIRAAREGRRVGSVDFGALEEGTVREAVEAVSALGGLSPKLQSGMMASRLRMIGTVVGLDIVGRSVRLDRNLPKFLVADIEAAPVGGSWVPPEFGSLTGGSLDRGHHGRFRLLVARGSVNEKELVEVLKRQGEQSHRPVILMTTEPLPLPRRRALERQARAEKIAFLLIDAFSLLFQPVGRASANASPFDLLLATSLPFGYLQPYVPQGSVPPEMFFGREDEMRELLDPHGSCFIYGGRQLGKSALLRSLRSRAHDPAEGLICTFIDLKGEGIGGRLPVDQVWGAIARHLRENGLPVDDETADRAGIVTAIRGWLDADRHRHVRLLLDESDAFLEQDAPEFSNVMALRNLMEATDRRFKVVLAGLHSVKRFSNIPNQPLAQFGATSPIGPLDWPDARALVEVPMRFAGFRFEPQQLVDRILVETRRHPSLVQFVCQALLEHFAGPAAGRRRQAPIDITSADLDDVFERSHFLRERIKERFEWTLNLDKRYRVLALLLAERSHADDRVRAEGLPGRELWEFALDLWPAGFESASRDEFDVLLEEMVNLEVFATSEGRYRLPAANVLRLLGDHDEITERLFAEIDAGGMPPSPNPERLRRPLDAHGKPRRSPLTFGDERTLLGRDGPPIRIVFGTPATRVEWVKPALELCAKSGEWREIEFDLRPSLNLPELARRYRKGATPDGRVVHAGRLSVLDAEGPEAALEQLRGLLTVLAERGLTDRVAVVGVSDHTTAPEWLTLRDGLDLELPGEARTVVLKRWDSMQLRVWLDELELPVANEVARDSILELTGGWPALTEGFAAAMAGGESVEEALNALRGDDTFLREAAERLDVDELPLAREVIAVMQQLDESLDVTAIAGFVDAPDATLTRVDQVILTLRMMEIVQRSGDGYVLEPVACRVLTSVATA